MRFGTRKQETNMSWYKRATETSFFKTRELDPANAHLTEWFMIKGFTLNGDEMPKETPLSQCLDWPELYEKYDVFNRTTIKLGTFPNLQSVRAVVYGPANHPIFLLNPNVFFGSYGKRTTPTRLLKSFQHEITHIILWEEGKRGLDYGGVPGKEGIEQSEGEAQAKENARSSPRDSLWPDDWDYARL